MKTANIRSLAFAIVIAASFTAVDDAVAQNDNMQQPQEEFKIVGTNKDTLIIKVLYENAPNYFNAPDMPRFAIIGKERKFYLGIGGYIKASVSYDLSNPIDNANCFVTSMIPMESVAGNSSLLQMSASASNLFFNFVALPHTKNQVGGYVNFNFSGSGNNYGFSLKAAYITYRGFILGYNTSLFTDGAASAPTIDQQGPNSMTFLFNTVLDYQYEINNHWKVGAGLELPVVDASYGKMAYAINQRIPDVPFYVQYSWAKGNGWLRASGLLRSMMYEDKSSGTTTDLGYGIKASGAVPLTSYLTMYYQGVYGKGIASYIQDMQGYGLDMVPVIKDYRGGVVLDETYTGELDAVEAWGLYAGLQWQISPKLLTSATYSMVKSDIPTTQPGNTYKSAQYVVANLFYNLTPSVRAGVEYLWGCRENLDGTFKQNNRIQSAVRVNF